MTEDEIIQIVLGLALVAFTLTSYYLYNTLKKAKHLLHVSSKRLERVHDNLMYGKLVLQKTRDTLKNKVDLKKANDLLQQATRKLGRRAVTQTDKKKVVKNGRRA